MQIRHDLDAYWLDALATGEHLSARRPAQVAYVKAVTLHWFQVALTECGWMCRSILDV